MMNPLLKELLDGIEYLKASDGEIYTPKENFISMYDQLISDSDAYFAELLDQVDIDAMNDEREIFEDAGAGHDGAMAVIERTISLLADATLVMKR